MLLLSGFVLFALATCLLVERLTGSSRAAFVSSLCGILASGPRCEGQPVALCELVRMPRRDDGRGGHERPDPVLQGSFRADAAEAAMEIPPGPFTAEVEERGAIGFVSAFPGRSAVRRPGRRT